MTTKQSNVEWVRCYYDAINRRDWEWIAAMLAPEVEWFHAARDERIKGVHGVITAFRSLIEPAPTALVDVRNVHDAGLVVVVECSIRHSAPRAERKSVPPSQRGGSGRAVTPPSFCEVLELSQGRCIRGATYADSVRLLMDVSTPVAAA